MPTCIVGIRLLAGGYFITTYFYPAQDYSLAGTSDREVTDSGHLPVIFFGNRIMTATRRHNYKRNFPAAYRTLLSRWYTYTLSREFEAVKTFVFFVGYPRSGHSLVGALLDAHPSAVVSHELNALELLRQGASRNQLFGSILAKSRYFHSTGNRWSGYSYRVDGLYQGRFQRLDVIGDKKGGGSSRLFAECPELIDRLRDLGCTIKVIHIVRNPWDNIVSRAQGGNANRREVTPARLQRATAKQLATYRNNAKLFESFPYDVHTVGIEEFTQAPRVRLNSIIDFLGLADEDDFLERCTAMVNPNLSRKRRLVTWPRDLHDEVAEAIDSWAVLRDRYAGECLGSPMW